MSIPELSMRPKSSCLHRSSETRLGQEPSKGLQEHNHHLKYAKEVEEMVQRPSTIRRAPTPFKGHFSSNEELEEALETE